MGLKLRVRVPIGAIIGAVGAAFAAGYALAVGDLPGAAGAVAALVVLAVVGLARFTVDTNTSDRGGDA